MSIAILNGALAQLQGLAAATAAGGGVSLQVIFRGTSFSWCNIVN
jgi:hypothetical protein